MNPTTVLPQSTIAAQILAQYGNQYYQENIKVDWYGHVV